MSSVKGHLEPGDVLQLLDKAREKNAALNVTGVLLYGNQCFFQVIEGDSDKIGQLYSDIEGDDRHTGVLKTLDETDENRLFPDWSMGFGKIEDTMEQLEKRVADVGDKPVGILMKTFASLNLQGG